MSRPNTPLVESLPQRKWEIYQVGQGVVDIGISPEYPERIRLSKHPFPNNSLKLVYANAQIDDYHQLQRPDFLWKPPLRMSLRARFSHPAVDTNLTLPGLSTAELNRPQQFHSVDRAKSVHRAKNSNSDEQSFLSGTAGFGFWNDPFMMTGSRRRTLPRAIWFFYSSWHSNMQLALGVPGWGWKAAVIDCLRPAFYSLLPTAPIGILLMRSKLLYRWLWPIAQRAMHVDEKPISFSLDKWRTYELEWQRNGARFFVDGEVVFHTRTAPRGSLGLVIWLDNQSMVVTPTGQFRSGLVSISKREYLEIEELQINNY